MSYFLALIFLYNFFSFIKLSKYADILSKIRRKASLKDSERYQDLSTEEKNKKWEYGCKRHKNLSEHEKQMLVEYRKLCYKVWKNKIALQIKSDWCFFLNVCLTIFLKGLCFW